MICKFSVIKLINNINYIIRQKKLRKCAVAKTAGFSKQQFSDMLNGRKIIRAEYIPQIAYALDVTVAELFIDDSSK